MRHSSPTFCLTVIYFYNFTIKVSSKYVIKPVSKIPPHLKCVTTLPCEISRSFIALDGQSLGLRISQYKGVCVKRSLSDRAALRHRHHRRHHHHRCHRPASVCADAVSCAALWLRVSRLKSTFNIPLTVTHAVRDEVCHWEVRNKSDDVVLTMRRHHSARHRDKATPTTHSPPCSLQCPIHNAAHRPHYYAQQTTTLNHSVNITLGQFSLLQPHKISNNNRSRTHLHVPCQNYQNLSHHFDPLLSSLAHNKWTYWIQAPFSYLQTPHHHQASVSAPPHHRSISPQHSLLITCNSRSSTYIIISTNYWSLFLICYTMSLVQASSVTASTSLHRWLFSFYFRHFHCISSMSSFIIHNSLFLSLPA